MCIPACPHGKKKKKKKTCQAPNVPTWHGLVYFVLPLARLRYSAHCAQCLPTETRVEVGGKHKKRAESDSPASHPLCSACYPGGRSPSWFAGGEPLLPGAERGRSQAAMNGGRRESRAQDPPARAHARPLYYCWHGKRDGRSTTHRQREVHSRAGSIWSRSRMNATSEAEHALRTCVIMCLYPCSHVCIDATHPLHK